jgi:hypothetical protein
MHLVLVNPTDQKHPTAQATASFPSIADYHGRKLVLLLA